MLEAFDILKERALRHVITWEGIWYTEQTSLNIL